MTVQKFSQIALSPSNLASTDFLVGVTAGNIDYRFSPAQIGAASDIIINTTPIIGGTPNLFLYDAAGAVGETATVTYDPTLGGVTFTGTNAIGSGIVVSHANVGIGIHDSGVGGHDWQIFGTTKSGQGYFGLFDNTAPQHTWWVTDFDNLGSFQLVSGAAFGWSANATFADNAMDTGISRGSANVVAVGNGTPGNISGSVNTNVYQIASLNALYRVANGSGDNWFVGNAGNLTVSGFGNMGMGHASLFNITAGGNSNTAIGIGTLFSATSAVNCVAIGASALSLLVSCVTGSVAIGVLAGASATSEGNTFIGNSCGSNVTTGQFNTFIGASFVPGFITGMTVVGGSHNIVIGAACDVPSASADGQLSIGNYIYGTGLTAGSSTISTGKIGIGIKVPNFNLDVAGSLGSSEAAFILHSSTTITNGAGTGTGVTFTNAPGSSAVTGNPRKWFPYDDNGTTYYFPGF